MNAEGLRALLKQLNYTQGAFANRLGMDQSSVAKLCSGAVPIRRIHELAIQGLLGETKPPRASRSRVNELLPTSLRAAPCPTCAGAVTWRRSKGEEWRGRRVWVGWCKTHTQNRSACPVTMIRFDRRGQVVDVGGQTGFKPLPWAKKFAFDKPQCPICGLSMNVGRPIRRIIRGGRVVEDETLTFYCEGDRWGKLGHARQTIHKNSKGGDEIRGYRGRMKRTADLPACLQTNYPQCCQRLMWRIKTYVSLRTRQTVYVFKCSKCKRLERLDSEGKPHKRYGYSGKAFRCCPECGAHLHKSSYRGKYGKPFERILCANFAIPHERRTYFIDRRNGRAYEMVRVGLRSAGGGQRWESRPISPAPNFSKKGGQTD
jgi:hypothetical protein